MENKEISFTEAQLLAKGYLNEVTKTSSSLGR